MAKIRLTQQYGCPIDGHAPELRGAAVQRYAAAGITTDHECHTLQEAHDKIAAGMHILIREGSAAKNFPALHPLMTSHPERCMFCSHDKHPDDLIRGHINTLVQRSVALGYDIMDVLHVACLHPGHHYRLPVGLFRPGDPADMIVVNNLRDFQGLQTYCQGHLVAERGQVLLPTVPVEPLNRFAATERRVEDFQRPVRSATVRTIAAIDGQLVIQERHVPAPTRHGLLTADVSGDLLKLAVINRYAEAPPAIALVHNFGLTRGALASSVAHDSHNIVAVGATDAELYAAVNAVIRAQGGIAVAAGQTIDIPPLPIAGLMSPDDGYAVGAQYARLDARAKQVGSTLSAPFMTLAFMALLVIPDLKLSDRGLFSGQDWRFVSLEVS
jgi:adenine deaminase